MTERPRAETGREVHPPSAEPMGRAREEPFGEEAFGDTAGTDEPEFSQRPKPMSVTGLFRRLVDDVATLFEKELALATSEVTSQVRHSIDDAKTGIASMLTGTAVLYAGFLFLLLSAMLGLALVVAAWLAALIVGASAVVIGGIVVQASRRKLRPSGFTLEHTVHSLRKDRELIGRQIQ